MSEVQVSSDIQRQNLLGCVRSSGIFRLIMAKPTRLRTKLRYLRTGNSKTCPVVVRSPGIFGQVMAKLARSCPKFRYLRTYKSKFCAVVSEVDVASDLRWQNLLSCVRSSRSFGLAIAKSTRLCPKFT